MRRRCGRRAADYIAFTKMANGQFYIGVMYPDGSGERLLASGYLVEGPTWSPNGRVLMYFRQDKGNSRSNAPGQAVFNRFDRI